MTGHDARQVKRETGWDNKFQGNCCLRLSSCQLLERGDEMDTEGRNKQAKKNRVVSLVIIVIGLLLTSSMFFESTINVQSLVSYLGLTLSGFIYYFLNRKSFISRGP